MTPTRTISLTKDPSGAPAVDLTKVREGGHVDLAKRADKAGIALSKRGLSGTRAQVVLLLDHSGSMRADYRSGAVQTLVERTLGFALQIDADGIIPVIPFDSHAHPAVNVGLSDSGGGMFRRRERVVSYQDVVNKHLWKSGNMGSTNMVAAFEKVKEMAATTDAPIYCAVVCDGSPDHKPPTTRIVCELAGYPVFVKFLAIREVPYLAELDDLDPSKRLLDNVDAKFFEDPSAPSDLQFADALADEWDAWFVAATDAGILR